MKMWKKNIAEVLPVKSSPVGSFRTVCTATLCASQTSTALPFLHRLTVLHVQCVCQWNRTLALWKEQKNYHRLGHPSSRTNTSSRKYTKGALTMKRYRITEYSFHIFHTITGSSMIRSIVYSQIMKKSAPLKKLIARNRTLKLEQKALEEKIP